MNFFIILLNKTINLLKYPIALLALFLTIELLQILYTIMATLFQDYLLYKYFFMGIGSYLFLWILLLYNKKSYWFLTIEHELTHALFALVTFHKIVDFKASETMGGYTQFSGVGGGNWLITIAPYFFPTFSMIIIGFIYFSQSQFYPLLVAILGYSMVYHIHSTYLETSFQQPDIKEVGLPFAFMFLPSANLFALIGIFSAIPNDGIDFFGIVMYLYRHENWLFTEGHKILQFIL